MKSGDYQDIQRRMEGAISAFKHDLASLRTGSGNRIRSAGIPNRHSNRRAVKCVSVGADILVVRAVQVLQFGNVIDRERRRLRPPL